MIRLFVEGELKEKSQLELSVFQSHYLCHVMRLKEKAEMVCFNGCQGEWLATLSYHKKKVFLNIQKQIQKQKNLPECILCPALIKKEAMDFVYVENNEQNISVSNEMKVEDYIQHLKEMFDILRKYQMKFNPQ